MHLFTSFCFFFLSLCSSRYVLKRETSWEAFERGGFFFGTSGVLQDELSSSLSVSSLADLFETDLEDNVHSGWIVGSYANSSSNWSSYSKVFLQLPDFLLPSFVLLYALISDFHLPHICSLLNPYPKLETCFLWYLWYIVFIFIFPILTRLTYP